MTNVKISKRDFDFYCHQLDKIIKVNSKFRNGTTNILCSVLNSRLLKPTKLKFSSMFIEFRYNLSIHVSYLQCFILLNAETCEICEYQSHTRTSQNEPIVAITILLLY